MDALSPGDLVWYCNAPLGKNSLATMMSSISKVGKLSEAYTNHSVRATSITVMDHSGIDSRHIMKVSGHASETSLKSYSHSINDSKKRQMSCVLSDSLVGSTSSAKKLPRVSTPQATVTSASCPDLSLADIEDVPELGNDIMRILDEPFELEAVPCTKKQGLVDKTSIQNNVLNMPVVSSKGNEQNTQGYISFEPKCDANCNVTIHFNNYYNK